MKNIWRAQSPMMKRIWIVLGVVTLVILVHGSFTLRGNYQAAFAQAVEQKIAIQSVHAKTSGSVLVLTGHATKPQSEYAEEIARMFIRRFAKKAIAAPHDVRNEIETGSVVTLSPARTAIGAGRKIASVSKSSKPQRRN